MRSIATRPARRLMRLLAALIPLTLVAAACSDDDDNLTNPPDVAEEFPLDFDGAFTSLWTEAYADGIALTNENTIPELPQIEEKLLDGYWVWDAWPVRNPGGSVARIGDWYVLVALTAPDTLVPGARHGRAELRYLISQDGDAWQLGDRLFEPGTAEGNAQWAGSALYDPTTQRLTIFYTGIGYGDIDPSGDDEFAGEEQDASTQRIVMTQTQVLATTDAGLQLGEWGPHRVILEPQGRWYEQQQNADGVWAFRDPWYYQDPLSGRSFLLFTANLAFVGIEPSAAVRFWPTQPGGAPNFSHGDVPSDQPTNPILKNGVVGIAVAEGSDLQDWRLLPPLLAAPDVNSQLERPHFVVRDNQYYLFFSSHAFTFADPITGYDGLYGFVSDSLTGLYKPLNGTGLVAANPQSAPYQTYSYVVLPSLQVLSYVGYQNLGSVTLSEISAQSEQFKKDRFGGTLAPTFGIAINERGTRVTGFNGVDFALPLP